MEIKLAEDTITFEELKDLSSWILTNKKLTKDVQTSSFESELSVLDENERLEYLQSMGLIESGLDQLARVSFDLLGLQTYLTAGPKETRAWVISKGSLAPQAAGVIHSDFEKGFIRANVISFDELMSLGSVKHAKDEGKLRQEGKDYVMQDGDVVEFLFNV